MNGRRSGFTRTAARFLNKAVASGSAIRETSYASPEMLSVRAKGVPPGMLEGRLTTGGPS